MSSVASDVPCARVVIAGGSWIGAVASAFRAFGWRVSFDNVLPLSLAVCDEKAAADLVVVVALDSSSRGVTEIERCRWLA